MPQQLHMAHELSSVAAAAEGDRLLGGPASAGGQERAGLQLAVDHEGGGNSQICRVYLCICSSADEGTAARFPAYFLKRMRELGARAWNAELPYPGARCGQEVEASPRPQDSRCSWRLLWG